MKRAYLICLFQCLATTFLLSKSNPAPRLNQSARVAPPVSTSQADPKAQARILDSYGKLPLSFEANHGQTDGRVKFLSRTRGYSLFLTADEALLALSVKTKLDKAKVATAAYTLRSGKATTNAGGVLRMKLRNANAAAKVTGVDELSGTSNYFIGNDPTKWRTNVPTYAKVKYEGIYSGIDLVYYGNQRQLEYDFIVAPGADPRRIAFEVSGAKRIRRDAHGDLVLRMETSEDEIRWHKPVVYQEKDGAQELVAARYAITDGNRVGFELAKYDASRPLYIDPLIYSTYLAGKYDDLAYGIAVDGGGDAYLTGFTDSTDFPVTPGAYQTACNGGSNGCGFNAVGDVFVTKINPAGSALVYSTYLGGSGTENGQGIAVDSAGNAYVTGWTTSTDFPTKNRLQPTYGGGYQDGFVAKLNPAGSALVYSTYLGGSAWDIGYGIAVDSAGNAYVTGATASTDFPTTPGSFQTVCGGGSNCQYYADAFVSKINPEGSALVYSTYLGGTNTESAYGIAVDSAGDAYVTGGTGSSNFPTTPGAFQTACKDPNHCEGAYVTKLNPSGSALVYSTYLGGSGSDKGLGIALDSSRNAYVTGVTNSTDFPTKNPLQPTFGGGYWDAFVSKLNRTGSALVYSTYLGGNETEDLTPNGAGGGSIAVDSAGSAYVTGLTFSYNFPVKSPLKKLCNGGTGCHVYGDSYVSKLNPAGTALVYSTFLGGTSYDISTGIAVDSAGNAYVTGTTFSTDFPTTSGAFQSSCGSNCGTLNVFVTKLFIAAVTTTKLSSSPNPSTYGQAVTFTAVVTSSMGPPPDGETVTFKKGTAVLGTGTLSGGSASFTTSALPVGTDYIKAVYSGDSNFTASTSKAVSQVVGKATTTTTLTSSLNPSNVGQSVTFTASVTPQFTGTVKGSVTFYDGTTALQTMALSGGVAKFTTSTLTSGAHTITATYNASTSFTGSSASLTQTVN